ncbi:MAG TPA: arabinan endo-1,5-alpha-L-arabinosidase [Verrucomicrobiae bacterium]|nr:arabinan endo-1,5-alpha-L-arabinosidase [Verrucomicrobiae bacterium]
MARWLKWLACLAASIIYGSAATENAADMAPAVSASVSTAPAAATAPPAETGKDSAKPQPPMPSMAEMGKTNVFVHDPSTVIKDKDTYWVFCTAQRGDRGVSSRFSKDLVHWQNGPAVLSTMPEWVPDAVGRTVTGFWAPDITRSKDGYRLYYAVSTFGSRTSAIALATSPTLDPADPNYKWTDRGIVFQTHAPAGGVPGDNFNAIDPAIINEPDGKMWMCFGSFWQGIKLIELDPATGKRIAPDSRIYSLATNNNSSHDVEASYIFKHDGYYYLFVDWGRCCQGIYSTYKIMMGRSKEITGPYLDKNGVDLAKGGGTLFLGSEGDFVGPGHAGIIEDNGKFWFSCHFYDASGGPTGGTLAVRPLRWEADGWPAVDPKQNYVAENTRVNPRGQRGGNAGGTGRGRGRAGTGRATGTGTGAASGASSNSAAAAPAQSSSSG